MNSTIAVITEINRFALFKTSQEIYARFRIFIKVILGTDLKTTFKNFNYLLLIKNIKYNGAPTLIIEILSPSNQYNDTFVILNKYEIFGVNEYWIVDSSREIITLYNYIDKLTLTFSNLLAPVTKFI